MARTNGPIQVWHRTDTIPTDAEGGYAGGDSTAAAITTAGAQATAAMNSMENLSATATALPAGASPTVTVTGAIPNKVINIGVPRGADGAPGMGYEEGQQLLAQNQTTLTAAQAAQTSAASSASDAADAVTLAQQAQAAALEVPDANVSALIGNPVTDTREALGRVAQPVDVAPSGVAATDAANVIAAALAAKNAGRREVRLADGHYLLDGVTVADIHDRYLVGDGATVSQNSWVYPFRTADLNARSARSASTGGRGRIAIELDDALPSHWRQVFPLTKELGITLGTAWHTDNGAQWIPEAYRHGWEVICHLPQNTTAVEYRDSGQLDAAVESSLATIEAAIGTRKNLGFVYPQHVRDDDTDRILSKYFTYGRGIAFTKVFPPDTGHGWLTASFALDPEFSTTGLGISQKVIDALDAVANTNGGMVFYAHHDAARDAAFQAGLRALVKACRERGVDIVNPSQIAATRYMPVDTYFEATAPAWTADLGAVASTERAYHGGKSIKFTNPGVTGRVRYSDQMPIPTRPGMFTVMRASMRLSVDSPTSVTSNGQGLKFGAVTYRRSHATPVPFSDGGTYNTRPFPLTGVDVPAMDWERVQELQYFHPDVESISPRVTYQNASAATPAIYGDEWRIQHLDFVPQVTYEATLIGTGNVIVYTEILDLGRCVIAVVPSTTPAGVVTAVAASGGRLIVKSTNSADTMPFKVILTPGGGSWGDGLTASGA